VNTTIDSTLEPITRLVITVVICPTTLYFLLFLSRMEKGFDVGFVNLKVDAMDDSAFG